MNAEKFFKALGDELWEMSTFQEEGEGDIVFQLKARILQSFSVAIEAAVETATKPENDKNQ